MTIGEFKKYFIETFRNYEIVERSSILSMLLEESLGMNNVEAHIYHHKEITAEQLSELKRRLIFRCRTANKKHISSA